MNDLPNIEDVYDDIVLKRAQREIQSHDMRVIVSTLRKTFSELGLIIPIITVCEGKLWGGQLVEEPLHFIVYPNQSSGAAERILKGMGYEVRLG